MTTCVCCLTRDGRITTTVPPPPCADVWKNTAGGVNESAGRKALSTIKTHVDSLEDEESKEAAREMGMAIARGLSLLGCNQGDTPQHSPCMRAPISPLQARPVIYLQARPVVTPNQVYFWHRQLPDGCRVQVRQVARHMGHRVTVAQAMAIGRILARKLRLRKRSKVCNSGPRTFFKEHVPQIVSAVRKFFRAGQPVRAAMQ